jgi:hypothetical protein
MRAVYSGVYGQKKKPNRIDPQLRVWREDSRACRAGS